MTRNGCHSNFPVKIGTFKRSSFGSSGRGAGDAVVGEVAGLMMVYTFAPMTSKVGGKVSNSG
jgi:hypothetical protein